MPQGSQYDQASAEATATAYDSEAEATGWFGPEVALGLVFERLLPGQSALDLGTGTGRVAVLFHKAGLTVHGLDISAEMLDSCRWKGLDNLTQHDLTDTPYPYASGSFDHVTCLGVLPFLRDPSPVFSEAARVLRTDGCFAFMTLDRAADEEPELVVGPEHTKTDEYVTMYRHDDKQIDTWIDGFGLVLWRSLPFTAYSDADKTRPMRAKCYVARKKRVTS